MACSFFERVYAMKAVDQFANIYLCREFVDFRKSINGLSAIVAGDLSLDLKKSALFIFCNKRRTHMKMLYFDKSGFALWLKRLEDAKFPWPKDIHKNVVDISPEDLQLLLDGVNIWTRFETIYFEAVV
jgi:transposase